MRYPRATELVQRGKESREGWSSLPREWGAAPQHSPTAATSEGPASCPLQGLRAQRCFSSQPWPRGPWKRVGAKIQGWGWRDAAATQKEMPCERRKGGGGSYNAPSNRVKEPSPQPTLPPSPFPLTLTSSWSRGGPGLQLVVSCRDPTSGSVGRNPNEKETHGPRPSGLGGAGSSLPSWARGPRPHDC